MEKTYLYRLYHESKGLFIIVILFIVFQAFFTFKRVQNFPFFIFDMYSRPVQMKEEINLTTIKVNERVFDYTSVPAWSEATILGTFDIYRENYLYHRDPYDIAKQQRIGSMTPGPFKEYLMWNITNQPDAIKRYPTWIFDYLENVTRSNNKITSIEFLKTTYKMVDGTPKKINEISLFKLKNAN